MTAKAMINPVLPGIIHTVQVLLPPLMPLFQYLDSSLGHSQVRKQCILTSYSDPPSGSQSYASVTIYIL